MNIIDKNIDPFKNIIQDFFDEITDSYYEGTEKNSQLAVNHSDRKSLLIWLKKAFKNVRKVDDQLENSIGKTVFKSVSVPVKIFARLRVEEFYYATLISNLISNLLNDDNMQEYGFTKQQVSLIQVKWSNLIKRATSIRNFQAKAKIDETILRRSEYNEFISELKNLSPGLNFFVEGFEDYVYFEECEKFLKDKRDD